MKKILKAVVCKSIGGELGAGKCQKTLACLSIRQPAAQFRRSEKFMQLVA